MTKNIKIKDVTHGRLAKNVKLKKDTYDIIINRSLDAYESVAKLRNLVNGAFNELLNVCKGNMERERRVKEQRKAIMDLLKDKVN